MAQATDYDIANATASTVRSDINTVLAAVKSSNSGAASPASPVEGMLWYDSDASPEVLSVYSGGAWRQVVSFDSNGSNFIGGDLKATSSTGLDFQNSSGTSRMTMDDSGNFACDGTITAGSNITAYSDERLKSDIETLDGSKVYQMRGVSYTMNGSAGSGVIAQELSEVAPELVDDSREHLSVAYGNLVGYLIEAVKDLKQEVEELKARVD